MEIPLSSATPEGLVWEGKPKTTPGAFYARYLRLVRALREEREPLLGRRKKPARRTAR